jgi:hypothetical protein
MAYMELTGWFDISYLAKIPDKTRQDSSTNILHFNPIIHFHLEFFRGQDNPMQF